MGKHGPARRRTTWLLLIAFLHAVLMPSLGMAAGRESVARTVLLQLCNAADRSAIEIELPDAGGKADAATDAGHSGFCLLCFSPATPPGLDLAVAAPAAAEFIPPIAPDDPEPRLAAAWNHCRPRAPPHSA